jgi:hypothetical protein
LRDLTPPHSTPTPPHPNRRTLRHYYARGRRSSSCYFEIFSRSHKKESRLCVEVPVLVSSPEVWAHTVSSSSGRPLGFLYSWVLLMFGLGTLSGGLPSVRRTQ